MHRGAAAGAPVLGLRRCRGEAASRGEQVGVAKEHAGRGILGVGVGVRHRGGICLPCVPASAFAFPASALPDWDSKEGWIDVLSAPTVAPEAVSEETTDMDDDAITNEEPSDAEPGVLGMIVDQECSSVVGAGDAYDDSVGHSSRHRCLGDLASHQLVSCKSLFCNRISNAKDFVFATSTVFHTALCFSAHASTSTLIATCSIGADEI